MKFSLKKECELEENCQTTEIALTFLNKKIPNDLELTFENKQKYLASLARRGFSTSDCLEAMERYESDRFLSN